MTPELRFISFRVGAETFIADIMAIRQIVLHSGSTAVPGAAAFVEGIITLRDEVIPIVDLRRRFFPNLPSSPEPSFVLIIDSAAGPIGLKVDEVGRIVSARADELLPPRRSSATCAASSSSRWFLAATVCYW